MIQIVMKKNLDLELTMIVKNHTHQDKVRIKEVDPIRQDQAQEIKQVDLIHQERLQGNLVHLNLIHQNHLMVHRHHQNPILQDLMVTHQDLIMDLDRNIQRIKIVLINLIINNIKKSRDGIFFYINFFSMIDHH